MLELISAVALVATSVAVAAGVCLTVVTMFVVAVRAYRRG